MNHSQPLWLGNFLLTRLLIERYLNTFLCEDLKDKSLLIYCYVLHFIDLFAHTSDFPHDFLRLSAHSYTWAHRGPWLVIVGVFDEGERVHHPSLLRVMESFFSWTRRDSSLSEISCPHIKCLWSMGNQMEKYLCHSLWRLFVILHLDPGDLLSRGERKSLIVHLIILRYVK